MSNINDNNNNNERAEERGTVNALSSPKMDPSVQQSMIMNSERLWQLHTTSCRYSPLAYFAKRLCRPLILTNFPSQETQRA